jgi:hypothetical protein
MSSEPFVSKATPQVAERPLIDQPLIPRYNIFIENYSKPNCIVDAIPLEAMPDSSVHNIIFSVINDWKAKVLLLIPRSPSLSSFAFLFSTSFSC